MSRLIEADKLKEELGKSWAFENTLYDVCRIINDAPTIKVPKWIPCSERLPNRQGYYICTCKDGSKYKRTTTVKWSNGWQLTGVRAYWIVLAWMPLPEPWKGDRP